MLNIPCIPVPSPQNIQNQLFPNGVLSPMSLPKVWSAQALLTPFGGLSSSTISPGDQLVIANLTYESISPTEQLMRVSLYALESLYYYDFMFHTSNGRTNWWWLVSNPNTPNSLPTQIFGPFATAANVPAQDFLRGNGFSHVGAWRVQGRPCNAFSARRGTHPDSNNPGNAVPNAATVLWFDAGSNRPTRLMNIDHGNDFRIAILGAYYIVDLPSFTSLTSSTLGEVYKLCSQRAGTTSAPPSPMVTLADVLAAMARPPGGSQVSCTISQIQALIPGLSQAPARISPPSWTDRVNSECYMLGQDTYPYYCQLWYDWNFGAQVTVFVQQDTNGSYTTRFDEFLPKGSLGPAIGYQWNNSSWAPVCCQAGGSVVSMPVPNFVQAGNGRCRAILKGNPYFGDMSIWSVMLGDPKSGWADFWYSFNDKQQGVIFSLAPASSLTIIDYQTFVQDGNIDACVFDNPCANLPACQPEVMAAQAKMRFRPLFHSFPGS
jgi:hypothetical protein